MASRPRKAERTRQAILDAALAFLWTDPFRDLTVESLMARTGSSRPAFYQYFADLHDLMETLLHGIQADILRVARPWLEGEGDPVPLLQVSLAGLVEVCHAQGPIVRAVSDATSTDAQLERAWTDFMNVFDEAVAARIEEQQEAGLIPAFDARTVAIALNRMDAAVLIQQFGQRPQGDPEIVCQTLTWIWTSTLYGPEGRTRLDVPCLPGKATGRQRVSGEPESRPADSAANVSGARPGAGAAARRAKRTRAKAD